MPPTDRPDPSRVPPAVQRRAREVGVWGTYSGGGIDATKLFPWADGDEITEYLADGTHFDMLSVDAAGWLYAWDVADIETWSNIRIDAPDGTDWVVTITYDNGDSTVLYLGADNVTAWDLWDWAHRYGVDQERGDINS